VPTLLTHPAVPLALRAGLGARRLPGRLLLVAIAGSLLPDVDVVGFRFGIAYGDLLGHRGLSHSLLVAGCLAALATLFAGRLGASRSATFGVVFLATASHGLLDAFTDGGLGVALLSPFDRARYFFPWRPIEVSPIGIARFFSADSLAVLRSEIVWIWLPCIVAALLIRALTSGARTPPPAAPEST